MSDYILIDQEAKDKILAYTATRRAFTQEDLLRNVFEIDYISAHHCFREKGFSHSFLIRIGQIVSGLGYKKKHYGRKRATYYIREGTTGLEEIKFLNYAFYQKPRKREVK